MNVKNLVAAIAVFAAAGSAFAQQTEFIQPDAGFKQSLTRAQVSRSLLGADAQTLLASHQHDGQDVVYPGSTLARKDVKADAIRAASVRHYGDVNDNYFGG